MSLLDFIDDVEEREKTLTVFTAAEDEQLFSELADFFEVQNITVRRGEVEAGGPQNFVVLHQGDEAVAVSTLEAVRDSLFIQDQRAPSPERFHRTEETTPDVLASLGNTTFTARGEDRYLVTGLSHYVEELAWRAEGGQLHAGFGPFSTFEPETGTFDIYTKLVGAGVDVHLYGGLEGSLPADAGFTVHEATTDELRRSRFVVFDGAGDPTDEAAMIAIEDEAGSVRGFWTFDSALVEEIRAYLRRTYPE